MFRDPDSAPLRSRSPRILPNCREGLSGRAWTLAALCVFLSGRVTTAAGGAQDAVAVDVVVCVEASAVSTPVLQSITGPFWRAVTDTLVTRAVARVGLVVYRSDGPQPDVRIQKFSPDFDSTGRTLARVSPGGGGVTVPAGRAALVAALDARELGDWRPGARRLVVMIARHAPLATREEIDAVVRSSPDTTPTIVGLMLPGASLPEWRLFADLVRRSGGLLGTVSQFVATPSLTAPLLSLLLPASDAGSDGVVTSVSGRRFEARFFGRQPEIGGEVLVFSPETPTLLVAIGSVSTAEGANFVVEITGTFTVEEVTAGGRVRIVPAFEHP